VIFAREKSACIYCAEPLTDKLNRNATIGNRGTLDHLVPKCQGGSNHAANIVLSCKRCNAERGAKAVWNFAHYEALRRVYDAIASTRANGQAAHARDALLAEIKKKLAGTPMRILDIPRQP
jgi:hypothetical protein